MALRLPLEIPPLLPDPDEARRWAEQELSDPAYQAAEPTGIDRLARDLAEQLGRLFDVDTTGGVGQLAVIALVVVIAAVIVAAFLVWGMPRITARTARSDAALFGGESARSAAEHRRMADDAVARGDWDTAILERVRAIARALAERLIVEAPPGATVHAFAGHAAQAFPGRAGELDRAAAAFDDVRYLRRPGTAEVAASLETLDRDLAATRPVRDEALV